MSTLVPSEQARLVEAGRVEHAIKLNLLRRQMDDEAWADAFERLAEIRQVRLGSGGDQTVKVAVRSGDLAAELGVSDRQARRKRQNAKRIKQPRLGKGARNDLGQDGPSSASQSRRRRSVPTGAPRKILGNLGVANHPATPPRTSSRAAVLKKAARA